MRKDRRCSWYIEFIRDEEVGSRVLLVKNRKLLCITRLDGSILRRRLRVSVHCSYTKTNSVTLNLPNDDVISTAYTIGCYIIGVYVYIE